MKNLVFTLLMILASSKGFTQNLETVHSYIHGSNERGDSIVHTYYDFEQKTVLYQQTKNGWNETCYFTDTTNKRNDNPYFLLTIKSNADSYEDTSNAGRIKNDIKHYKRKVNVIKYYNNGIGTEVVVDTLGNLVGISNFIIGMEDNIYYAVYLNYKGQLHFVNENNLDSSLCNMSNATYKNDTINFDTDAPVIYDSRINTEEPIIERHRMRENGRYILYNPAGQPVESHDSIKGIARNRKRR